MSLGTLLAHPMHKLAAAKSGVVRMNAIYSIALRVPFMQQLMLCCFKCGVLCSHFTSFIPTTRTSAVIQRTVCNYSLPLMAADWAPPLSSGAAASKRLLRCFGVLIIVSILHLTRCLGSKRAVLTNCFPCTVWAFAASCAIAHSNLPDMRDACWTVGAYCA